MKKIIKYIFPLTPVFIILIIVLTIINTGNKIKNPSPSKIATSTNEIVAYGTNYVYDDTMPENADPVVIEEGINGLSSTYDGLNYTTLSTVKDQTVRVGTAKAGNFTGKLTGYGPDCPGCSSVGNVACKTREGTNHSLITDGIYYNDTEYGNVRIVAADNGAFPCGTIVKINNGRLEEFTAIVLDTGSSMRNAWDEGIVWMDVAFSSQKVAKTGGATSSNTKFSVQRWGW